MAFGDYQDLLTGLVVTSKLSLVVRTHAIREHVAREYVVPGMQTPEGPEASNERAAR